MNSNSSLIRSNSPHLVNRLNGSQTRLSGSRLRLDSSEPRLDGSQPRLNESQPRFKNDSTENEIDQPKTDQPDHFVKIEEKIDHVENDHDPKELEETSKNKSNEEIITEPPVDITKKSKKKSKKKKEKKSEEILVPEKPISDGKASSNSLSGFSEGVGEQKLQGDLKKDEKRLEVKIPADSDGMNEAIRLSVKVSLEIEMELNRNLDLETMMLRLRRGSKLFLDFLNLGKSPLL